MAERVGFEKALSDRLFAFNKMPKTDVFTVTYLLSHLEHKSQKKRRFTLIAMITVWTVWIRFCAHHDFSENQVIVYPDLGWP
jgi:hypothetical protein